MSLQKRLFSLIFIASLSQITHTKPEDAPSTLEKILRLQSERENLQIKRKELRQKKNEYLDRMSNTLKGATIAFGGTAAYAILKDAPKSILYEWLKKGGAPHIAARLGIFALPGSVPVALLYSSMTAGLVLYKRYMNNYSKEVEKNQDEQKTLTERINELVAFNNNTSQ